MTSIESVIWIAARLLLGIFLSLALPAVVWVMSRLFLQYFSLETTTIFLVQSLIIGIPAGIGAVVAWWNLEAPARVRAFTALIVPLATALLRLANGRDSRRLYLLRLARWLAPRTRHRHWRTAQHDHRHLSHRRQYPRRRRLPLPRPPPPRILTQHKKPFPLNGFAEVGKW